LKKRFRDDRKQGRIMVRCEDPKSTYSTELISRIFEAEAGGEFDSRWTILGHLQQGTLPSPLDRIRAIRMAVLCVRRIEEVLGHAMGAASPPVKEIIGIRGPQLEFTNVNELAPHADLERRVAVKPWWLGLRPMVRMLAKYGPSPPHTAQNGYMSF
jgi:6-phosphofructokinase 1